MAYSPMAVSDYFNKRIRDFYAVPLGIEFNIWDLNFGMPGKPMDWRIKMSNVGHAHPWEAPFGRIDGPDFTRVFHIIWKEIESKFGFSIAEGK